MHKDDSNTIYYFRYCFIKCKLHIRLTGVQVNEDLKPIYAIFPTYLMPEAVYGIVLRDVLCIS